MPNAEGRMEEAQLADMIGRLTRSVQSGRSVLFSVGRYEMEQLLDALAAARAENARMREERDVFVRGLLAVRDLMSESRGVCGLHRNGDEAEWSSLQTGGRFEGWLTEFDAARDRALAAQEGTR